MCISSLFVHSAQSLTFFGVASTVFVALAMMFHSRHHTIHEHELRIRNLLIDLIEHSGIDQKTRQPETKEDWRNRVTERVYNLESQYETIKKRYFWARWALMALMVQTFLMIAIVIVIAIEEFKISGYLWILFVPGVLAILMQILGDLRKAGDTQRKSRSYVDGLLQCWNCQNCANLEPDLKTDP